MRKTNCIILVLLCIALLLSACSGPLKNSSSESESSKSDITSTDDTSLDNDSTGSSEKEDDSSTSEQSTGETNSENAAKDTTTSTKKDSSSTATDKTTNKTNKSQTTKVTISPTKPTDKRREEMISLCNDIIKVETQRLKKYQLTNGAIPMYNISNGGTSKLSPYFSCSAALGLLEAGEKESVKKYINWHFNHLETKDVNGLSGTIYDYQINVSGGKIKETTLHSLDAKQDYDSTDSYAALFLILLDEYVKSTGDKSYISSRKNDINRIVDVMTATIHNSLTYCKPNYKIKYLMDNCEVYEGYLAAQSLYKNVFSDKARENDAASKAKTIKGGIEKLWNDKNQNYDFALGNRSVSNQFYPSGAAQLFPASFSVIDHTSQRAQSLYSDFFNNYSSWQTLSTGDYPWVILLRATLAHKDYDRTYDFLKNVKSKYIDSSGSSRWYCQESGLTIWAASKLKKAL